MAVTGAQAKGSGESVKPGEAKAQTTLDDNVSMPSKVAPGDGPFDTTDPTEIATSVSPDKGAAAAAGHGTVNAVLPLERIPGHMTPEEVAEWNGVKSGAARTETFKAVGPDGKQVTVTLNQDTGESKVS